MTYQISKNGWVPDWKWDHGFVRIGHEVHRLQDVPDRIERLPWHFWGRNFPRFLLESHFRFVARKKHCCLLLLKPKNLCIDDQIKKYLLMAFFSGTLYRNIWTFKFNYGFHLSPCSSTGNWLVNVTRPIAGKPYDAN